MQDMRKQGSLNRHEQSSYELIETGRKKIRFLQWNDTSGVKPTRADLMFKSSRSTNNGLHVFVYVLLFG